MHLGHVASQCKWKVANTLKVFITDKISESVVQHPAIVILNLALFKNVVVKV